MHSKEAFVKNTFNTIAERYDLANLIISFGRCEYWRKALIQKVGKLSGAVLIDVCCGTGKVTADLAKKVGPDGEVIGVDLSERMLDVAKKYILKRNMNRNTGYGAIKFIEGNALKLPFPDNTFDGATIAYGLRNVTDLRQALLEMKRVVKPGGLVASLEMAVPCGPVLTKLYNIYAGRCIPLIGKALTSDKESYRYLYQSIITYLSPDEVTSIFEELGFLNAKCYKLTLGVVAIHLGIKPAT